MPMKYAVLVYQGGIANVFELSALSVAPEARTRRLIQSTFGECEAFARGLKAAGVIVTTWACNQAGDIARAEWSADLEAQPFSDKFKPVFSVGLVD